MKSVVLIAAVVAASAHSSSQQLLDNSTQPGLGCAAGLENVYGPTDDEYETRIRSYFSVSARLEPGCIVQPTSAEEVSLALTTLVERTGCNFAVRGGGHTAFPVDDGVTIDLGLMRTTTYDVEKKVASIPPGTTWATAYGDLEPYNVTVAGGRTGTVGIGGFLTGGGNTFYAAREGFGCDTVVNYEIVLANGEIVNANKEENSDLFRALKGGGSNYGIITRFDMETFDVGLMWGGLVTYDTSHREEFVDAYIDWTDNIEHYVNGSVIPFWSYQPESAGGDVILLAYEDINGVEAAPAFDKFMGIEAAASTMRMDTHKRLADELELAGGYRNIATSITFKNQKELYQKTLEMRDQFVEDFKAQSPDGDFIVHAIFQSIPTIIAQHGVEKGGNMLGLDRVEDNAVLFQVQMMMKGQDQEDEARRRLKEFRETLKQHTVDVGGDVDWEYLNYADLTQDPLRTYGPDNIAFMKEVSLKYDPEQVFQTRMPGGFKVSEVEF